jgi:hypothetical protein
MVLDKKILFNHRRKNGCTKPLFQKPLFLIKTCYEQNNTNCRFPIRSRLYKGLAKSNSII